MHYYQSLTYLVYPILSFEAFLHFLLYVPHIQIFFQVVQKKFNISNNSLYGRFKFMRYYINELFLLFLILFICSLTAASSLLTAANFSLVSVSLSFAIKSLLSEFIKSCFAPFNSLIFF